MRIALTLIPALALAACGTDPATSATAAGTGTSDTQTGGTTQDNPTTGATSAGSTGDQPTGGSITGGMTESGTTSSTGDATTTTTDATTTGATTTGATTGTGDPDTGSTSPVGTETNPMETTTTDGTTTTAGSSSEGGEDSTTEAVESCPCPDLEVPLDDGIFVLAQNSSIWKFFPETNDLVQLGTPTCDLPPATFSMAVDRLGFAWIQFSGGELRKVAVGDLNMCTNPGYVPGQQGISNFGMAFVSNSDFDKCDRIFGAQYNGISEAPMTADFFSIDPMNQALMKLGKADFGSAEVTGTGDGRVFLFAPGALSKLVQVDRTNGKTLSSIPLPGVQAGGGWAFAFFAGDFYLFTDGQSDGKSEVTHVDYDDSDNNGKQDITVVVNNAPLKIVGAGVSTCAPTLPQ